MTKIRFLFYFNIFIILGFINLFVLFDLFIWYEDSILLEFLSMFEFKKEVCSSLLEFIFELIILLPAFIKDLLLSLLFIILLLYFWYAVFSIFIFFDNFIILLFELSLLVLLSFIVELILFIEFL
jgi:hypothetical protein